MGLQKYQNILRIVHFKRHKTNTKTVNVRKTIGIDDEDSEEELLIFIG